MSHSSSEAIKKYREFVAEGLHQGRRPDLLGGGLVRSAGGWQAVKELIRGREAFVADEGVERLPGSRAGAYLRSTIFRVWLSRPHVRRQK